MNDFKAVYDKAVAECLAKKPKTEDYETPDILNNPGVNGERLERAQLLYYSAKRDWQRDTCTKLLTLRELLPEEIKP